jgi:predicted alpha-1,2-mannosidase
VTGGCDTGGGGQRLLWGKGIVAIICACIASLAPALARPGPLTAYVDPFIGTDGTGHAFPGPSAPFGMVQPGPDNAASGWEYTSGYQFRAPRILGFSQTRASGTGIPELGDVLVMPSRTRREDFASRYDKASETARPGYYAVTLGDNDVRVELTASELSAFHRYRFGSGGRVWVLVDMQHGLTFRTDRQPVLESRSHVTRNGVEGWQRRSNWTTRTVAFSLAFDQPVAQSIELPRRAGDAAARYLLAFDLPAAGVLQMKAGLSSVDVAGARANRESTPGWDFDAVAEGTAAQWESLLSRAEIEAPDRQKRIFYTALYHAFLHPSRISDTDGRWRGPDGEVRRATGGIRYSTLSLWDTFRAAHALYTLLVPERVDDFILTLLDHGEAAGRLPMWTIWGGETGTMIGEPALPVIAEAWAKGFRGFDGRRALDLMVQTSTEENWVSASAEDGVSPWLLLDRYGYLPFDLAGGESVSRTLEAGIGDDATARMAAMLGANDVAATFARRAEGWRNLIDPETRLVRGRDSKGGWRTPFDPLTPTSPLNNPGDYTEANAWQYSWTPGLFDPEGLVEAMGGREAFRRKLDTFFFDLKPLEGWEYLGQEAMIGQYAHGNEPSHHVAWLYAFTDRPETGQALVRRIASSFYADTPNGLIGNDDAGQMSAWYVFATLGLYPVVPASGDYVLGRPLVSKAVLRLANGSLLEILAPQPDAESLYTPHATLRGGPPLTIVRHQDLTGGGQLRFSPAPR